MDVSKGLGHVIKCGRRAEQQQGGDSETMSRDAALALGLQNQRAGHCAEAEHIYLQILAAVPDNVDALHLLGVAEHQPPRILKALGL